jgi:hypothetical protein
MSYSIAPVAWGRDDLGFGGANHIVGTQFGIRALRTRTDVRHAQTDARYSRSGTVGGTELTWTFAISKAWSTFRTECCLNKCKFHT